MVMVYGYSIIQKEFQDMLSESILDMLYQDESIITENANLKMTKDFYDLLREYKNHMKSSAKAFKKKNYDRSIQELEKSKESVKKFENKIKNIDASGSDSVVFGFLLGISISFVQYYTISFGTYGETNVSKTVGDSVKKGAKLTDKVLKSCFLYTPWLGNAFAPIIVTYNTIIEIKARYKEDKKNGKSNSDCYNLYKTKLLEVIGSFYNAIDKTTKVIIDHERKDMMKNGERDEGLEAKKKDLKNVSINKINELH